MRQLGDRRGSRPLPALRVQEIGESALDELVLALPIEAIVAFGFEVPFGHDEQRHDGQGRAAATRIATAPPMLWPTRPHSRFSSASTRVDDRLRHDPPAIAESPACRCTRGPGNRSGASGVRTEPGLRPASTLLSRKYTASNARTEQAGHHPVPRHSAGTHHQRVGRRAACVASLVMTRDRSAVDKYALGSAGPSPAPGALPGLPLTPVTPSPRTTSSTSTPTRSSACSTGSGGSRTSSTRPPPRLRFARRDRPRRALRRRRVLPGGDQAGIKPIIGVETYVARRSMTDRERKADSQPFHLDPAGDGPHRLPQPLPARHRRPHRRLLLQAADRPRAPRQATARAWSACRACLGGEIAQGARGRGLGPRPHGRRRVPRHPGPGPLLPRAPGPRHARAAPAQRAAAAAGARRWACRSS